MKVARFTGDARESTPDNFSTIGPHGSRLFAKHTQDGIINGIINGVINGIINGITDERNVRAELAISP